MKKIQQESMQEKDARYLVDVIDAGFANNEINHAKTQAMLNEIRQLASELVLMKESNQPIKNNIQEKEQLYKNIFKSFVFLADRFCLLSHTSKAAEFAHLPALIQRFEYMINELESELNKGFYEMLILLLSRMKMEEDEHLNGLEEKSLGLKQINFRIPLNAFKQAYEVFMSCRYNDDFDFWYYLNFQKSNNRFDSDLMLIKGMEEMADLAKEDILNPMTANRFYRECLKIYLIDCFYDEDDIDFDESLSVFSQELLDDYDNSELINPKAYEKVKNIVYDVK